MIGTSAVDECLACLKEEVKGVVEWPGAGAEDCRLAT